ncbi:MAG: hypothetical protein ABR964_14885 [Tepidisphaeraceae bacterium]|jgi:hypothetical protein
MRELKLDNLTHPSSSIDTTDNARSRSVHLTWLMKDREREFGLVQFNRSGGEATRYGRESSAERTMAEACVAMIQPPPMPTAPCAPSSARSEWLRVSAM